MLVVPKQGVIIIESNVPEIDTDFDVWDAGTNYNTGDFVQVVENHTIYRSVAIDGNIGNDPRDDEFSENWVSYGNTNYKKAFDPKRSTKCKNTDSIYYKFLISDVDSLALIGIQAKTVNIKVTNNLTATVIYDEDFETLDRDVYDWHDWTYAVSEYKNSIFTKLPMAFDAFLEITLENTGGIAEVGHIAFGRSLNIGLALIKPEPVASIRNIASKTKDVFGDNVTELSVTYKRMIVNVILNSISIDKVQNRLEKLNGIPCLFVADERVDGFSSLIIYGLHKDFDLPIGLTMSQYQLEIEGFN
jgi:hypothetical protein